MGWGGRGRVGEGGVPVESRYLICFLHYKYLLHFCLVFSLENIHFCFVFIIGNQNYTEMAGTSVPRT